MKRQRSVVTFALLGLVLSACGSRMSHDEVIDALRLSAGSAPETTRSTTGTSPTETGGTSGTAPVGGSTTDRTAPRAPSGSTGAVSRGGSTGTTGATSSTSGTTSGGRVAACKAGGSGPIKLGAVGTYSGLVGGAQGSARQTLQAWAASLNAGGGICGRPVQITIVDDQSRNDLNLSLTQDLVENKKVVAFVGNFVPLTVDGSANYLASKGIPVIGGDTVTNRWTNSPVLFPQGATLAAITRAMAGALGPGKKLAWWYCAEAQACADADQEMYAKGAYKRAGVTMVYRQQVSLADTEADYTSTCREAVKLGVQLISIGASGSGVQAAAAACKKAGYTGAFTTSALGVTQPQAEDPNLDKRFFVPTNTFPFSDSSSPARKLFHAMLDRYAPDIRPSGAASQAWTAGKLFEAVVQNLKGKDITPSNLLAAAQTLPPTDLGGLTGTLHFRRGNQPPQPCTGLIIASGGTFLPANGGKFTC